MLMKGDFASVMSNVKQKSYHVPLYRQVCYSCFHVLLLISNGCTQHIKHYIMTMVWHWHCITIILTVRLFLDYEFELEYEKKHL